MDNFRIPPSPTWYIPPICSPENGLLYIAGNHTSIAYIPPVQKDDASKESKQNSVTIIQTRNQFKSIDCDPIWLSTRWFVTMNEQNIIWVWNLETGKICRGHKAHTNYKGFQGDSDSQLGGAMCISKKRQVFSIDRNAFVRYCMVSNTFSIFPDNFILKRGTVSMLKTSPYNQDIIAVGYKNGLIVIANYAENTTLQKFRGHDSEIVSLQWTLIKSEESQNGAKINLLGSPRIEFQKTVEPNSNVSIAMAKCKQKTDKSQKKREPPKPIVDASDMFDIHSYDYLEDEFGTISGQVSNENCVDTNAPGPPTRNNNQHFNFFEECQTLREQIACTENQSSSDESNDDCNDRSAVNMTDIREFMENKSLQEDSIMQSNGSDDLIEVDALSNHSTIGSSHNTTEIVELEEVINNLNINEETSIDSNDCIYLASGAQESSVIIWNIQTGDISDKIQLKSEKGRAKIPKSNCTIAWIHPYEFVVNGPDGKVSMWKINNDVSSMNKNLKFSSVPVDYADTAVINICSNAEYMTNKPIVWTFSTHLYIIGHSFSDETSEVISKYATLPIGMNTLRICPHDPNKIAIAGNNKRINILELSTLTATNIDVISLTSKIQGKILALSWNPNNENLLSFSTNEGRVGVFNINKISNAPDLMKNFNGKNVYGLSHSVDSESKKWTLFATNEQKLMKFNENSTKQDNHNALNLLVTVSSVSANEAYIAIGLSDGTLKILLNEQQNMEIFSEKIAKKYLSELSWSALDKRKLAVSSNDNGISILSGSHRGFMRTGELIGHEAGVTFVSWSGQSEHKLVSASFDHTVRVWDTEKMQCIAWFEYENKMHCAAFLPTDEDFVICSGQSETMHIFEITKRLVENIGKFESKKKKISFNNEIQWGTQYQNEASKLQSQEKKRLRQIERKSTENSYETADTLDASKLSSIPIKLNHTTILYLTNKELNKEPLNQLQTILSAPNGRMAGAKNEFLHSKLFGNREDVVQLLEDELKNHKLSKTDSIGNLLIPQIKFELKANIMECIEGKSLTEQHISLAPSISYEFWKNCSLAYANQCIEQGFILQAIPHLLATQQINKAIEKLCDTNFHREAWCIAKVSKESEDKIFEIIVSKWIGYLEQLGNLEGASLISFFAGKRDLSFNLLNKRKSKTPQIECILNTLSQVATQKSN